MRTLIYIFYLLVFVAAFSSGQSIMNEKLNVAVSEFRVDYAEFYDISEEKSRLEIYYQVFNSDLLFIRNGDKFEASYTITVSVVNKKNIPVVSKNREKEIVTDQYVRTISRSDFRTGQINFHLSPGKYGIECHLYDNKSRKSFKKKMNVTIQKFQRRHPQVSGSEFVFAADTTIFDSTFIKSGMTIIPNVGRVFGEDTTSVLSYYFEIFKGNSKDEKILIETRLLDRKLKTAHFDSVTSNFDSPIIAQFRQVAIKELKGGEYTLDITLKGRRGKAVDNFQKKFHIYWSPEGMVLNDYKTAVKQLKYIAVPAEIKKIESLTNSAERLQAWNDFWATHDSTPETVENEIKISYYYRLELANRRYTSMGRNGWATDRGRVLILFGEPDLIEDYPFEQNNRAYQVWSYYNVDNQPREFLFIDEWNNSDYVLQYPYDGVRY